MALVVAGAVALVVAFALGSGSRTPRIGAPAAAEAGPDESYGFVATDVVVQQTDASGRLQYEVLAAQVERRDDAAPLVARQLTLNYEALDDSGRAVPSRRWVLRADEGQLPARGAELALAGNVELQGQLAGSTRPLVVRTDQLFYHTAEQTVRTPGQVQFSWGRQQLEGRGLTANFSTGALALESGVHGRILP